MPKCDPVLLEPIHLRRSLGAERLHRAGAAPHLRPARPDPGLDGKPGWEGWDVVAAHLPRAELHDLIVELRSLTLGVGTFADKFDHLQELTGRLAEKVIQDRAAAHAAQ